MTSIITAFVLLTTATSLPAQPVAGGTDTVAAVKRSYFHIGGGYAMTFIHPSWDRVNNLTNELGTGAFDGPLIADGWDIALRIDYLVRGLRLGIGHASGTIERSASLDLQGVRHTRMIRAGVRETMVRIGYSPDFASLGNLAFYGVAGFGGGLQTIELGQEGADGGIIPWLLGGSDSSIASPNRYERMEATFFSVGPELAIEYNPSWLWWMKLHVSAGYCWSFLSSWRDRTGLEINGMQKADVAGGARARIGLSAGIFLF